MIQYRQAHLTDVPQLVELERKHVNAELSRHDPSLQGQGLTQVQLTHLINQHWIILALDGAKIVGYVIAAQWSFFGKQALYQKIIQKLPSLGLDGLPLRVNQDNSLQYGPIWIAESYRGQGIFSRLVEQLVLTIKHKSDYLVAYIAEDNGRSFKAHTQYADMHVVDYFGFQHRDFYLLLRKLS